MGSNFQRITPSQSQDYTFESQTDFTIDETSLKLLVDMGFEQEVCYKLVTLIVRMPQQHYDYIIMILKELLLGYRKVVCHR